jgi:hypothetical protein
MEVATMYDLVTQDQAALTLRGEVEQLLVRSRESMLYTSELANEALEAMSRITLTGQTRVIADQFISDMLLEGAMRRGMLPDTQSVIVAMRQNYLEAASLAQVQALQGVLQELRRALGEGVPPKETNPIIRFLQGK